MGYQVYRINKDTGGYRFAGYGVPAICEHPDCLKEIDRGVSYACGGVPNSEHGCDRYFCSEHLNYVYFKEDGLLCRHRKDCDCDSFEICEMCSKQKNPFPYKNESKEWVKHVIKDKSWKEWRQKNPEIVAEYQKILLGNE
jgi:hypothetical protein